MSKIVWDQIGQHLYETGTDRGVVYPADSNGNYPKGYGWNGLTGYTESPSGADETALYADNIKYLSLRSAEEFGATITAYSYPDEFAELDGSKIATPGVTVYQQARHSFGLCVRTLVGNDVDSNDYGYKLHLVYGLTASPSERGYSTVNDSPEAIEFSWELKSIPVPFSKGNYKPTSVITIDSTKVDGTKLQELEAILYGTDGVVSYDAVSDPVATTYSAVAEPGSVNPSEQVPTWYERSGDGSTVPYTYAPTQDTVVDGEKTYYTKNAGDNPSTKDGGWYERSGSEGSYTYTKTSDVEVNTEKTYYKKTSTDGTDPRLPLPDEVLEKLTPPTTGG